MKLVIDASVAVKWFVKEPGHDDALAILSRGDECFAPDLIISEVAGALDKKIKKPEITSSQAVEAISSLQSHLSFFSANKCVIKALELASELNHPVADCVYMACAMDIGATVVTADAEFVRKASNRGYGKLVRQLGDETEAYSALLDLSKAEITKIEELALKSRKVFEFVKKELFEGRQNTPFYIYKPSDLRPAFDSPNLRRLSQHIESLEPDVRCALLALCWLGRGYNGDNLIDLIARAKQSNLGDQLHIPYVISQLSHLSKGLTLLETLSDNSQDR